MRDFSKSYGVRRPLEIAARIAAIRTRFAPTTKAPEVAPTPVLALVPAVTTYAARVAQMQAERAEIRADLPFMRHYAANFDDGPTLAEIEALEQRLKDLDDYLIFEPDTCAAPTFNALPLAA